MSLVAIYAKTILDLVVRAMLLFKVALHPVGEGVIKNEIRSEIVPIVEIVRRTVIAYLAVALLVRRIIRGEVAGMIDLSEGVTVTEEIGEEALVVQ